MKYKIKISLCVFTGYSYPEIDRKVFKNLDLKNYTIQDLENFPKNKLHSEIEHYVEGIIIENYNVSIKLIWTNEDNWDYELENSMFLEQPK